MNVTYLLCSLDAFILSLGTGPVFPSSIPTALSTSQAEEQVNNCVSYEAFQNMKWIFGVSSRAVNQNKCSLNGLQGCSGLEVFQGIIIFDT